MRASAPNRILLLNLRSYLFNDELHVLERAAKRVIRDSVSASDTFELDTFELLAANKDLSVVSRW